MKTERSVVDFFNSHPMVEKVYWPGLPSHPGHDVASRQMSGFGGMISFTIKGDNLATSKQICRIS